MPITMTIEDGKLVTHKVQDVQELGIRAGAGVLAIILAVLFAKNQTGVYRKISFAGIVARIVILSAGTAIVVQKFADAKES